jgi:uncharacterized membrane protein
VIFHYIELGNRKLIWLNLVFLLALSPLPFLTELRSAFPAVPIVAVLVGASQILCGLLLYGIWRFAVIGSWGWPSRVDARTDRSMRVRILLGPALVVLATFAGLVDDRLASLIFLCMPLLYVSNAQVDAHWRDEGAAGPAQGP